MSKKWRRVRLGDLANPEEQAKILGLLDQAKGQPKTDLPGKRPSESPQVERSAGHLAHTPTPGEST